MAYRFVQQSGGTLSYDPPQAVVPYQVEGTVNPGAGIDPFDFIAAAALGSSSPIARTFAHPSGTLYLQDIRINENHAGRIYTISAPYGVLKKEVGAYQITVDGSGGTANVKAGERISGWADDPDDIVDNGGLIGVNRDTDEVVGIDVPIAQPRLTVNFRHPAGVLSAGYIRNVGKLVGFPNDAPFMGYEAGEVVYQSGPFTETDTEATAQYNFAISYNETFLDIGPVRVDEKSGWDVLSPTYRTTTKDGHKVQELQCLEVIRPRRWKSYAPFGWGS